MKITVDGHTLEGTPEELKELFTLMGAEFPVKESKETAEDTPTFREGDRVKALADGEDGDIKAGEVGNIYWIAGKARDQGDPYYIGVENDKDDLDYFRPQDLELVSEEEEAKPKPYKPSEGDIVVITANTNASRNKVGDIGKVGEVRLGNIAIVDVPGKTEGNGNWTKFSEMRPATAEEKAQYEAAVIFAKIGRKPGEFKKGDIVADGTGDAMFTVLSDHEIESGRVSFPESIYRNIEEVELIAPVESRVDVD